LCILRSAQVLFQRFDGLGGGAFAGRAHHDLLDPASRLPFVRNSEIALTRRRSARLVSLVAFAVLAGASHAQDYPARTVRIIVPVAAGATNDIVARLLAGKLAEQLKHPFIVENRPGGAQITGADFVAKSQPDGYTLLLGNTSILAIHASLFPKLPYDPQKAFEPVSIVAESPSVLVVNPSVPAGNVKDFIAYTKANPGKLNYGSPGNGTPFHLSMELFKRQTGTELVHVPFNGAQPAVTALLGNQVQALFDNTPNILPHIQAGKIRALAVTSPKRLGILPDVPTMAEAGFKGAESQSFFAIVAPQGTPPAVVKTLHAALVKSLQAPDLRQRLDQLGAVPLGNAPPEAAAYVARESARWAQVVKESGAKVDN
jgi:tripartite-type tricarboxylate transporter receptor subunit TctC